MELELLNLLLESVQCHSSYRVPKEKYQNLTFQMSNLLKGFQVTLLKPLGFKADMYSYKILDGKSLIVVEIKEDDSKIPYVASMTSALKSSASCFATASAWHKRFSYQRIEYINRISSNQIVNNL